MKPVPIILPLCFISIVFFASMLHAELRGGKDYLVTFPPGIQSGQEADCSVQLSLPGRNMAAALDKSNWQFAAAHNRFILVNFEMDYETLKSSSDVEKVFGNMMAVVQDLRGKGWRIPEDRIVLTGTSMGGSLALSLALHHPETFRHVGIVSGAWPAFWVDDIADKARGLHFYVIHGKDDRVVPLGRAQKTIDHLIRNRAVVKHEIVDHAGHNLNSAAYRRISDWLAADLGETNRSKNQ